MLLSLSNPNRLFRLTCLASALLLAGAGSATALPALFDFGAGPVQSGWVGIDPASPSGVSEGISLVLSATGTEGFDDRDRGGMGNGGGTESDMWRDFIFAVPDATNTDGLQIDLSGLAADSFYEITIWSFDSAGAQVDTRVSQWNGNNYIFAPKGGLPETLDDNRVTFQIQADAMGLAQVIGDSFETTVPGVFLNGASVVLVPEPGTSLLLGLGLVLLSRRRSEA